MTETEKNELEQKWFQLGWEAAIKEVAFLIDHGWDAAKIRDWCEEQGADK